MKISTHINGITRCFLPQPNSISRNAQHGAESSEPAEAMSPPWKLVVQVLDGCPLHNVEDENALKARKSAKKSFKNTKIPYKADGRRREAPAELPPSNRVVPNHVFNTIIESLNAKAPRH